MKRLFRMILVIVILLLITIHQAISANAPQIHLPYKQVELKHTSSKKKIEENKPLKVKSSLEKQPDIVKEYVTKRSRSSNWC
jgi:hypothetical protein